MRRIPKEVNFSLRIVPIGVVILRAVLEGDALPTVRQNVGIGEDYFRTEFAEFLASRFLLLLKEPFVDDYGDVFHPIPTPPKGIASYEAVLLARCELYVNAVWTRMHRLRDG